MIKAVIGLGFGDEGKGMTTNYLCSLSENPIVVRYSGGPQAGHTVVHNGVRHVFSSFGAGTLSGAPTHWTKRCPVDPVSFYNEYCVLDEKGIVPTIFIDNDCPIITPYDKRANQNDSDNINHGSCGLGFGKTIEREEKRYSLKFSDIFNKTVLAIKIKEIKKYYGFQFDHEKEFLSCCNFMRNCRQIKTLIPDYKEHSDVIYESSQGLLLDQDIGFFPHVTRSSVGTKNIPGYYIERYLVTRAYQTRHGNGPMTNEKIPHKIYNDPKETNVKNKYQGEFRKTLLDLDLLKYGIEKDGNNYCSDTLVITCLDHIRNDYRFTINKEVVECAGEDDFVNKVSKELGFDKVIKIPTCKG